MVCLIIILLILFLVAVFPFKVRIKYYDSNFLAELYLLFARIQLFPSVPSEKKIEKKEKKKEKPEEIKKKKERGTSIKLTGSKVDLVKSLVPVVFNILNRLRRKITIRLLKLHYTVASDDPCDTAINYGRISAAINVAMPLLEKVFHISQRDIKTLIDFENDKADIDAEVIIVIRIWEIIYILCGLIPAIKILLKSTSITKNREVDNYGQAPN